MEKDNAQQKSFFYFDRIKINFYIDKKKVVSHLKPGQLERLLNEEQSHSKAFRPASQKMRLSGYRSILDIVAATPAALDILHDLDRSLQKAYNEVPYKISYLEVSRDIICQTPERAIDMTREMEGVKLKWMNKKDNTNYHFKPRLYNPAIDQKTKTDFFISSSTYYSGGRSTRLSSYSRISKIEREPCCHIEFRLAQAASIQRKCGIETLRDLTPASAEESFFRLWDKYAYYGEIDLLRLGKWILGIESLQKISEDKKQEAIRQAKCFCLCADKINDKEEFSGNEQRFRPINTYKDLCLYLKNKKTQIMERRGRRSYVDQRYLNVKPYRFKL